MKKLLVIALVLSLVLGMGITAFAEYDDWAEVIIEKELTVGGGVNPAEEFEFTVGAGTGVRDGVAITAPGFDTTTFEIDVAQGGTTGTMDIDLPLFTQVGVYTYPITETVNDTAGFDYDGATYYLVVTVINDGAGGFKRVVTLTDDNNLKRDAFENNFDAGKLTVTKEVTGNFADPDDVFEVTVTLTPVAGKTLNPDAILAAGGVKTLSADEQTVTIVYNLKDGEAFTIENIPYDVDYAVVETHDTRYDLPIYDNNANGEMDEAAIETTITNNRDIDIIVGVNLDNLPYILILVGAAVGLVGLTMRRRLFREE